MADLHVGDVLLVRFGPYQATGTVSEVNDIGAVIKLNDDAELVGYSKPLRAPNGTVLTDDSRSTFLGRAHWHAPESVGFEVRGLADPL